MSIAPLAAEHWPEAEAFLLRHRATSLFPLTNMRDHGPGSTHPRGVALFASRQGAEGPLTGVLALSNEGVAFPQVPEPDALQEAAALLGGQTLRGLIGPTDQVRALEALLGLTARAREANSDEPLMELSLAQLRPTPGPGELAPLGAHRTTAIAWRAAYGREVLGWPEAEAARRAEADIEAYIDRDSHRILAIGATPRAMTGFNARHNDVVQIGGVFTPPESRGQHLARRALYLHLDEAHQEGARHAVLFASGAPAMRAYAALGFHQTGEFTIIVFA